MLKHNEINATILEMLRANEQRLRDKADQIDSLQVDCASTQNDLQEARAKIDQLCLLLKSHNIEIPDHNDD